MKCSIGSFAYDDELCRKPIHARRSYMMRYSYHMREENETIKKLNVACGRRVSYVLVKLMLQQSLSSPFYIVKQRITRSLESFLHAFYPLTLVHVCILIEVVKLPINQRIGWDWRFHHIDGGVTNNNASSNIKHIYFLRNKRATWAEWVQASTSSSPSSSSISCE